MSVLCEELPLTMAFLQYQPGFGNSFESEAVPGEKTA